MTAKKKTVIGYVLASLAIIAADQTLKAWVVRNIPLNASAAQQRALIPGVVHLTHIRNSGVAFGMFSGGRWLFLALLAAFCVIVVWALVRHKLTAPWERWLAVLAMAGAIGNGIDRALYGYVVDMFELEFMHFAVFNIADIAINVCCILFVLLMLLRSRDWKAGRTERPELGDRLWLLSRLNVMALLLATIAGFGGIIGIFVRFIRGYNRISPYIAFFALLAVGLALEKQLTRRTGRSRKVLAAVAILLLGYGYWEQQGFFRPEYEEIQDKWYQDEAFMNEVEAAAGDGAMLFTLPYMKNFENGSLNNMWDYTLLRGPLHSKTLKFTYGAGYGTKNDLWYRETSELEPDAMVAELRTQGMTGIYLDLDGYPEDEQQSALAALTEAAGCGPEDVIHSGSGLLCYIPLGQE